MLSSSANTSGQRRRQDVQRSLSERHVRAPHRFAASAKRRQQQQLQRSRSDRHCTTVVSRSLAVQPQEQVVPGVPMEQHVVNLRRLAQRMLHPSRSRRCLHSSSSSGGGNVAVVSVEHVLERTDAAKRLFSIIEMEIQHRRAHRRRLRMDSTGIAANTSFLEETDEYNGDTDENGDKNRDVVHDEVWEREEKLLMELKALVDKACRAAWSQAEGRRRKDGWRRNIIEDIFFRRKKEDKDHRDEEENEDENEDEKSNHKGESERSQRSNSMLCSPRIERDEAVERRGESLTISRRASEPSTLPLPTKRRDDSTSSSATFDETEQEVPETAQEEIELTDSTNDTKVKDQSREFDQSEHIAGKKSERVGKETEKVYKRVVPVGSWSLTAGK